MKNSKSTLENFEAVTISNLHNVQGGKPSNRGLLDDEELLDLIEMDLEDLD